MDEDNCSFKHMGSLFEQQISSSTIISFNLFFIKGVMKNNYNLRIIAELVVGFRRFHALFKGLITS